MTNGTKCFLFFFNKFAHGGHVKYANSNWTAQLKLMQACFKCSVFGSDSEFDVLS